MSILNVNGNSYNDEDLSGKKYTRSFPNIAQDVFDSYFKTQTAICRQTFTACLGVFTFKVEANKSFYKHMKFAAFLAAPAPGDYSGWSVNAPVFSGKILGYDKGTGNLTVRIEHLSLNGTYSTLYFRADVVSTAAVTNTIANGLTGNGNRTLALETLRKGRVGITNIRASLGVMGQTTLPSPYYASVSGTGTLNPYYKDVYAGAFVMASALGLTPGTGRAAIYLGPKPWIKYRTTLWGTFRFSSPSALADVTNNYKVSIGFRGYGSTEAAPFGHSGMGVTYNYAENAGNWIGRSGNNGSVTTTNSAFAFAASTEYEIKVRSVANQAHFTVNGNILSTLTAPVSAVLNNFLHPFIMIERLAGTSPSMYAEEIDIGGF